MVVAFVGLACLSVNGQAAYTPFSAYGIGDYYGNGLVHNQGMGGVGISNPQSWYVNNQNPALLVFNTLTSFSAGYLVESRTIRNSSIKEKNTNGNINYLVLGLPIKRGKWTTSIGLMPYTNMNYKLTYPLQVENSTQTLNTTETGAGGVNQLSWSHGVAITRNISIGAKANYLFSSTDIINQLDGSFPLSYHVRQHFSDFNFTGGLSIRKDSLTKKNHRLNFGLVYDFKTKIKTKYLESISLNGTPQDTLFNNVVGQTVLPQVISGGLSYGRPEFWTIATDFSFLDYTSFRDVSESIDGALLREFETTKGWKWAIGGEITPDPLSVSSYLKRMTYRTGVSLEKYPYLINGNTLQDMSVNFGFSMPVSRVSNLDFAVKYGQRGDIKTNTVSEKYFKVSLGITFNDQWFIKRRFD